MKTLLAVIGGFVLLSLFMPLALIGQLLFGWAAFLRRVIPAVRIDPGSVALGTVCLIAVAVLGHWMASWLWREMHAGNTTPRWRLRWTAISLGIILLTFVCGLAATGVAHQTGWLIQSEEPLFRRSIRPAAIRVRCGSEMRKIGFGIREYAEAHDGHFPESLAVLGDPDGYREFSEWTACPSDAGLSYVYYGRGLMWPAGEGVPILAEPLVNHEVEGMNILFGDGDVRFVEVVEAEAILARRPR